jgi:hypothetical protein
VGGDFAFEGALEWLNRNAFPVDLELYRRCIAEL